MDYSMHVKNRKKKEPNLFQMKDFPHLKKSFKAIKRKS